METLKQTLQKFSKFIIAGVVLVALLVAYNIFYLQPKKEAGGDFIRSQNQTITSSELGREIVSILNQLKTVTIDPEFFQDPRFRRLVDFSVEIQPQPVGKENPFREFDLFSPRALQELEGAEVLEEVGENPAPISGEPLI